MMRENSKVQIFRRLCDAAMRMMCENSKVQIFLKPKAPQRSPCEFHALLRPRILWHKSPKQVQMSQNPIYKLQIRVYPQGVEPLQISNPCELKILLNQGLNQKKHSTKFRPHHTLKKNSEFSPQF